MPEMRYQARLDRMVEAMTEATRKEVERYFRKEWAADGVAMDASFTSGVSRLLSQLSKRFTALFTDRAGGLAEALNKGVSDVTARQLGESLKDVSGGVTLKTDVVSGRVAEVMKAGVKENVALIKSIPADYFQRIQGDVMRSIQTGAGMADLVPAILAHGQSTKKRAELIARDQTSKATTAINRARMQGLGIKQFEWLHSGGGKEPRALHLQLDGQIFDLDNPPVIDNRTGERGLPGQLINCRCRMVPVVTFGEPAE
jgi:SPP1 gp7 family putative phage head morphogenesis protein